MINDALTIPVTLNRWVGRPIGVTGAVDPVDSGNSDQNKTRLKGVVKEVEALFIYELLKEMRQTTQDGFLGKGMGNDIYGSLFDMELARQFAERGLGLGELILKQMEDRVGKGMTYSIPSPKDQKLSSLNEEKPPVSSSVRSQESRDLEGVDPISQHNSPVDGQISSAFGWREDPFSGQKEFHAGIDITARSGQAIFPINKGRVLFRGLTQGYGNTVVIDHEDGLVSKYGHNLTNLVSLGEEVNPGQVIALVGRTGRSTGPHLHLEVQYEGKRVNPLKWVNNEQDP